MADSVLSWRPSRPLTPRSRWWWWALCLALLPLALWVQEVTALDTGEISSIRVDLLITFLLVMLGWLRPGGVRGRHHHRVAPRTRDRLVVVGLTLLVASTVHLLTQHWLGVGWWPAARYAVAVAVQAVVTLAYYRWRIGDDNLAPHRPRDIAALGQASLLGAVAVIPLGPAPGMWVDSSTFALSWWVVLSSAYVFAGSACLMLLVQRRPRSEAIPTRLTDVYVLLLATAVSLGVVLTFDDLPVTWIVLLPAIWAGLTLGPWTSAAFSMTAMLSVVVAQAVSAANGLYDTEDLPDLLLLDGLMLAFVYVVLLLSLVRDQRAYLAAEVVRRRQEAVDQAGLLGTVFESINEALVLMDVGGEVRLHNPAAVHLLGRDKLTSEPQRWLRRMPETDSFTYTYNRDGSDDGVRVLAVQLARVQYAGSDGVVAIVRDITSERARIEELAGFAAVAAHDLKSPLSAVQGWIEVAQDSLDSDAELVKGALERGSTATERMAREIDDWLTYAVVREGALEPVPVVLQPAVEAVAATHPGVDFTIATPDTVKVDPTLLQHLLTNLIGNAVKYSRPGERPVVTLRSFSGGERGWVRLYVVDAGIGIPEGEETTVFEPFRRASTVAGTYEGSGLGLALCKRIVRRHGGTIRAQRNEGHGTTITVTLPTPG